MRKIERTNEFKRDYKREKKSGKFKTLDEDLSNILHLLIMDKPLPYKNFDHQLRGEWKDYRDCHIKPDLVLIYKKSNNHTLILVRIGSHSQLGLS